jgi:hypothetical protein
MNTEANSRASNHTN